VSSKIVADKPVQLVVKVLKQIKEHRRQSGKAGGHDPQILGWGSWGLQEILLYRVPTVS